jgi:hypothetical protein
VITVSFCGEDAELEPADATTLADQLGELPEALPAARELGTELRAAQDSDTIDLDTDAAIAALLMLLRSTTRTRTGQQRELPSPGLRGLRRIIERGIWPHAAERP